MGTTSWWRRTTIDELLKKIRPIIYVHKEFPGDELDLVLYEKYEKYYVVWFHWPYDGFVSFDSKGYGIRHEDYEPIILVHEDSKLQNIGIRPSHSYESSEHWNTESERPVIIFWSAWHHPLVDLDKTLHRILKKSHDRMENYPMKEGQPQDTWFLAADSGKTVYEFADSLIP